MLAFEANAMNETDASDKSQNLSLQLSVGSRTHELEFLDNSLENSIIFRPNIAYIFRAGLTYKEQKIVLETDNLSDIGVDSKKGKSSYTDLHYSGFINKNQYSAYYGRYKGFYVAGQTDVSGNNFAFDDLNTKRYGFEYKSYGSEPRMTSVDNRNSQNYKELPEYFGTFTYGILFDVSNVNNVPSEPQILSQLNNSQYIFYNNLRLITLSPFGGLLGRASINGYYLESGLNIGFGLQKQDYGLDGVFKSGTDYSFTGDAFVTVGSVTPLGGIFGITFEVATVEPTVDDHEFSIATVDIRIFYKLLF